MSREQGSKSARFTTFGASTREASIDEVLAKSLP
jgi:hypothetical protein